MLEEIFEEKLHDEAGALTLLQADRTLVHLVKHEGTQPSQRLVDLGAEGENALAVKIRRCDALSLSDEIVHEHCDALAEIVAEHIGVGLGQIFLAKNIGADRIVDVVLHISDLVAVADDLPFQRGGVIAVLLKPL